MKLCETVFCESRGISLSCRLQLVEEPENTYTFYLWAVWTLLAIVTQHLQCHDLEFGSAWTPWNTKFTCTTWRRQSWCHSCSIHFNTLSWLPGLLHHWQLNLPSKAVKASCTTCAIMFQNLGYTCLTVRLVCSLGSQKFLGLANQEVQIRKRQTLQTSSHLTLSFHHDLCSQGCLYMLSLCRGPCRSATSRLKNNLCWGIGQFYTFRGSPP